MTTIRVRTHRGFEEVPGKKITDHLAATRVCDEEGKPIRGCWKVTHLPTGYAIPILLANEKEARAAAKAVENVVDWGFTDPDTVTLWKQDTIKAIFAAMGSVAASVRESRLWGYYCDR